VDIVSDMQHRPHRALWIYCSVDHCRRLFLWSTKDEILHTRTLMMDQDKPKRL